MDRLTYPIRGQKMEVSLAVTSVLADVQSPFQRIQVLETEVFGRALLLDGHIQLTEFDEAAYHECLVQIPLLNLPHAKSALIIGGGDGGALRELVKNARLTRIDMVEIDGAVIETCCHHLPSLSAGAFDDPRLNLHIADAFPFVKSQPGAYDLIIADSTDTYEGEDGAISQSLFTEGFYRDCLSALKPGGILVTQADNPVICPYSVDEILVQFERVFPEVGRYTGLVPSFGGYSAFVWGGKPDFSLTPGSGPDSVAPDRASAVAPRPPAARQALISGDRAGLDFSQLTYLNPGTYALAFAPLRFQPMPMV